MKRILKNIIASVAAVVFLLFVAYGVFWFAVPISRPNKSVRSYVMQKIPIGTNWNDTMEIIEKKDWEINQLNTDGGLCINEAADSIEFATIEEMINGSDNRNVKIVGEKAMYVELGELCSPFCTNVFAYLAFDESDKLIEIIIKKYTDSI